MKRFYFSLLLLFGMLLFFGFNTTDSSKNREKAGKKMQEFVIQISNFARKQKAGFIVIPQNGSELAFENVNPNNSLHLPFLKAIDGIAIEELFYNEKGQADEYRISNLKKLPATKKIIVSEFVKDSTQLEKINHQNLDAGFVPFIRTADNYHYHLLPAIINDENDHTITKLADVKNFLYLINADDFDTKKEFIEAIGQTNYDMVLIDLYYYSFPFTKAELELLKKKKNGGTRLVICYMNVGAAENWRGYWQPDWKLGNPKWLKKNYKGYDNEIYTEFWNSDWQKIIVGNPDSYTQKIINAGFDGVFLDNVEAYYALYND